MVGNAPNTIGTREFPVYIPLINRAPRIEYRCPNGHVVAREPKGFVWLGDPERRCPVCGTVTRVGAYVEWDDLAPRDRGRVVRGKLAAMLLGGVFLGALIGALLAVTAVVIEADESVALLLLGFGFALGVLSYPARFAIEVAASRRRSARRSSATP